MGLLFLARIKAADFAGENNRCVQTVTSGRKRPQIRCVSEVLLPLTTFWKKPSPFCLAESKIWTLNRLLNQRLCEIPISALLNGDI